MNGSGFLVDIYKLKSGKCVNKKKSLRPKRSWKLFHHPSKIPEDWDMNQFGITGYFLIVMGIREKAIGTNCVYIYNMRI